MCQCNPMMRTPFCGKGDCQWPKQNQSNDEAERVMVSGWQKYLGPIPPKNTPINSMLAEIWEKQRDAYERGFREGREFQARMLSSR